MSIDQQMLNLMEENKTLRIRLVTWQSTCTALSACLIVMLVSSCKPQADNDWQSILNGIPDQEMQRGEGV